MKRQAGDQSALATHSTVVSTSSGVLAVAKNFNRIKLILRHNGGTPTVYIGLGVIPTQFNGIALTQGGVAVERDFLGEVYLYSSSNVSVSVVEVSL